MATVAVKEGVFEIGVATLRRLPPVEWVKWSSRPGQLANAIFLTFTHCNITGYDLDTPMSSLMHSSGAVDCFCQV